MAIFDDMADELNQEIVLKESCLCADSGSNVFLGLFFLDKAGQSVAVARFRVIHIYIGSAQRFNWHHPLSPTFGTDARSALYSLTVNTAGNSTLSFVCHRVSTALC